MLDIHAKIHVEDVRLGGCYFTLYPAANKYNVEYKIVLSLVRALWEHSANSNPGKENPLIPLTFPQKVLRDHDMSKSHIDYYLSNNLITPAGSSDTFSLTEKMISILTDASSIQNQLDAEDFYYCPCAK